MVGDASNNFHPTRTLDKFETAKIFAMAAGYKYAANSISPAEQERFDRSYEDWKSLLDSMSAQYARWNKTADREIAYLLHLNILTVTDVGRFIVKQDNAETVTMLTRQEAIVYMIRLDGKQIQSETIALPYHTPYKDDAQIQADYKKFIYYAREAGIAVGSDGYINPTRQLTRAELAQLFYNTLAHRPAASAAPVPQYIDGNTTINGVIEYVFLDSHIYISVNNQPRAFAFAGNAVIIIDNVQRSAGSLSKGMSVTALTHNNEIVSLVARAAEEAPPPPPSAMPVTVYENEGYVVSTVTAGTPSVTIRTQRVKLTGEIVSEEKTYALSPGVNVKRGDTGVNFSDVKANDIVVFKHSGNEIFDMLLEEKDRIIFGTLVEKKFIPATNTPVLVVEDEKGVRYELRVTQSTRFTRNNNRNMGWNDMRIGDGIEADCEYDQLLFVFASGNRTQVTGRLLEIRLAQGGQQIVLERENGTQGTYDLTSNTVDIYTLRIGMTLQLHLDSWEVYGIDILRN
jgi:hypothetical protein